MLLFLWDRCSKMYVLSLSYSHTHTCTYTHSHTHTQTHTHTQYHSSALVIRYNRAVLEPTGDFQVGEGEPGAGSSTAFPWWGILIIVVGTLVLVALVAVVVMVRCLTTHKMTIHNNLCDLVLTIVWVECSSGILMPPIIM